MEIKNLGKREESTTNKRRRKARLRIKMFKRKHYFEYVVGSECFHVLLMSEYVAKFSVHSNKKFHFVTGRLHARQILFFFLILKNYRASSKTN
jgi:hypothetical protein